MKPLMGTCTCTCLGGFLLLIMECNIDKKTHVKLQNGISSNADVHVCTCSIPVFYPILHFTQNNMQFVGMLQQLEQYTNYNILFTVLVTCTCTCNSSCITINYTYIVHVHVHV